MLELHPRARDAIDEHARSLLERIRPHEMEGTDGGGFPSEMPKAGTITSETIVEEPILADVDALGRLIGKYFPSGEGWAGLVDDDYQELRRVAERLLKAPQARKRLGAAFVEDALFVWCRDRHLARIVDEFSDWVAARAAENVRKTTVWVPVARLEIEEGFALGGVTFRTITRKFLEESEAELASWSPDSDGEVKALFDHFREEMQGLAAVVVEVEAERRHAQDVAFAAAEAAIGFLRLFSPAASVPYLICPCAVLGSEAVPRVKCLSFAEGKRFDAVDRTVSTGSLHLRLSKAAADSMLRGRLKTMGKLLYDEGLTDFQSKIRASLLAYSKGTTLPDIGDRLVYVFSALESLLIRDTSEPLQQNLGERPTPSRGPGGRGPQAA